MSAHVIWYLSGERPASTISFVIFIVAATSKELLEHLFIIKLSIFKE